MVAKDEPFSAGRFEPGKKRVECLKVFPGHILVIDVPGQHDEVGVQVPDALFQFGDAAAVHRSAAGMQVTDLEDPQLSAGQFFLCCKAVSGGMQPHRAEIRPNHDERGQHPRKQPAHPERFPPLQCGTARQIGNQPDEVPHKVDSREVTFRNHARAKRVAAQPAGQNEQQKRNPKIRKRCSARKTGHKGQTQKIEVQHGR